MKKEKIIRLVLLLLISVLVLFAFASCGEKPENDQPDKPVEQCTINYWYNGAIALTKVVDVGSTLELATVPEKKGSLVFQGWYIKDTETLFTNESIVTGTQLDLEAIYGEPVYTYTIQYIVNGGTITDATYATSYTNLQMYDSIKLPAAERTGYIFDGWYNNEDCAGTPVTVVQTYSQEDQIYYAKWSMKEYSIRLYTNGGALSINKNRITYNFTSRVINLPTATKTGYTFDGWYESPSFQGTALTRFDPSALSNVTLYAKYTPINYHITLNAGDGVLEDTDIVYTVEDGLVELPTPTLVGKYFAGWYSNSSFTGEPQWDFNTGKASNKTLYAKYSDTKVSIEELEESLAILPGHDITVSSNYESLLVSLNYSDKKSKDISVAVPTSTGEYTRKFVYNKGTSSDGIRIFSDFDKSCWTTKYNAITFWAYSENLTNASFGIIGVISDTTSTTKFSYVRLDILVDWVGWKQVTVTFESMGSGGDVPFSNGLKWLWVGCNSGWGYSDTGIQDTPTIVYLSDIYLTYIESPYTVQPEDLTLADLTNVKNRLRDMLVGNETLNARSDINASYSYTEITGFVSKMDDTSETNLWSDIGTVESNGVNVQNHYERILKMAKAYGTPGSSCYKNKTILAGIVKALDWMYAKAYNEKTKSSGNWWQWQIGAPEALIKTLLIIEDDLNTNYKGRIAIYLKGVDHFTPKPSSTTANRTWTGYVALGAALLHNDAEQTVTVVQYLLSCFEYVTTGDGFYVDGSYIMHKKNPYLGGYGSNFMLEGTELLYAIQGSALKIDQSYFDNFMAFFFNSYVPFIYNAHTLAFVSGRGIVGYNSNGGANLYARIFDVIQFANEEDQAYYYNLLASEMKRTENDNLIKGGIKWISYEAYDEFKAKYDNNEFEIYDENPIYAHVYGNEDRVLKRASSYLVCLAMSSTRIYRYEAINGANQQGWYEGDGVLYVYSSPTDFDSTYWSNINMYRLPGITCTTGKRVNETQNSVDDSPLGTYAFVGGVENDAKNPIYAVCAMHFGPDTHAKDSKKAGYSEDIDAKKAYFIFDNEIVCIGNSITSSTTSDIYTVIDNRLNSSPAVTVNGESISVGNEVTYEGVNFMTVNGFGGIYFPDATDVVINKNGSHLEYYIDHGVAPENASYVYVLLPNMSGLATSRYASNSQITVIANNGNVTAVSESNTKSTGYVFWNANTTFDYITVKNACIIYTTEKANGSMTFSLSEPTQLLSKVTIELDGIYTVEGEGVEATVNAGKTTLVFNTKGLYGATTTVTITPSE